MRTPLPDAARAVLLLIDLQEHFRAVAAPVLPALATLVSRLRALATPVPVLYTQHGHEDPERDAGMLGQWWDDHILVDTPAWRLLPEVAPRGGEVVLRKKRYSAFAGTDLERRLREAGRRDLLIGGVMTNLCCETTARDAFVRDFRVFFLRDGTATASRAMHEASLLNLAYGFATLLTCREAAEALARPGSPR